MTHARFRFRFRHRRRRRRSVRVVSSRVHQQVRRARGEALRGVRGGRGFDSRRSLGGCRVVHARQSLGERRDFASANAPERFAPRRRGRRGVRVREHPRDRFLFGRFFLITCRFRFRFQKSRRRFRDDASPVVPSFTRCLSARFARRGIRLRRKRRVSLVAQHDFDELLHQARVQLLQLGVQLLERVRQALRRRLPVRRRVQTPRLRRRQRPHPRHLANKVRNRRGPRGVPRVESSRVRGGAISRRRFRAAGAARRREASV